MAACRCSASSCWGAEVSAAQAWGSRGRGRYALQASHARVIFLRFSGCCCWGVVDDEADSGDTAAIWARKRLRWRRKLWERAALVVPTRRASACGARATPDLHPGSAGCSWPATRPPAAPRPSPGPLARQLQPSASASASASASCPRPRSPPSRTARGTAAGPGAAQTRPSARGPALHAALHPFSAAPPPHHRLAAVIRLRFRQLLHSRSTARRH